MMGKMYDDIFIDISVVEYSKYKMCSLYVKSIKSISLYVHKQ